MIATMNYSARFRLIAVVLVSVLLVVVATPARAEAIDALTIVAIAGLALAGIVLIAYLIIANVEGDKVADAGRVIWVACIGDDCTTAPAAVEAVLAAAPAPVMGSQGP
jgi:hypothetical protein